MRRIPKRPRTAPRSRPQCAKTIQTTIKEDDITNIHTQVPEVIVSEHFLRNGDGSHLAVGSPFRSDYIDLSDGECRVEHVIGALRYDASQATLIAKQEQHR